MPTHLHKPSLRQEDRGQGEYSESQSKEVDINIIRVCVLHTEPLEMKDLAV